MRIPRHRPAVLILTSTFPRWKGDCEPPFVYELSRRLVDSFEVHVLAPHAPGCRTYEIMQGVHVHRFRYAPAGMERLAYRGGILGNLKKLPILLSLVPFFLVAQMLSAVGLLVRFRMRLIHAHWLFPQGLIAWLARVIRGGGVRVLCTCHGGDLYGLKGSIFKKIQKMAATGCDHLTVVSRSMSEDVRRLSVPRSKISLIPMGVDLQRLFVPPPQPAPATSLLFVGRLVEKKGLRYLLEAMPEINARFPGVRLTVVGDGPCRSQLERLAFELGLQGSVAFWGARRNEELPEIYRRSGIVVFPSVVGEDGDREGFGLVLVEALGCGCAAVATDLPAMKDIVENERTALIVRPKSPEAIAGAVLRLLANPQLTAGIAQNGRRHALQHFEWEAIAQGYRVLLKRLPDKLSDSVIERSSSRQFPSWRAHLRFTCAKRWR